MPAGLYPRRSVEERILSKINKTDACWLWTGCKNPNGYGQTWFKGKHMIAHRLTYTLFKGDIPEGMELDHLCRVRECVNPDHLEPVTHRENGLRGIGPAAIHARKTQCPKGHPYDEKNTAYQYKPNSVSRYCKACNRIKAAQRRRDMVTK